MTDVSEQYFQKNESVEVRPAHQKLPSIPGREVCEVNLRADATLRGLIENEGVGRDERLIEVTAIERNSLTIPDRLKLMNVYLIPSQSCTSSDALKRVLIKMKRHEMSSTNKQNHEIDSIRFHLLSDQARP